MIKANGMDILVFEHDDNSSSITYKDGLTTYHISLTNSTMWKMQLSLQNQ